MSVRSARTDCKSIVVIRGVVIRAEVMVRSADPFSVNPGQRVRGERMRRYAPQGGAAEE